MTGKRKDCIHHPHWTGVFGTCMVCRAEIAEENCKKLEAFKTYVHKRLDDAGVPENPDPVGNKEHGCRIGGRFNWLLRENMEAIQ